MARFSLLPTFLVLNYTTAYGTHKMSLATAPVVPQVDTLLFPYGQFQDPIGAVVGTGAGEVGSMIGAFVDQLVKWWTIDTTVTDWELWQVPNPGAWISNADRNQAPDVLYAARLTNKIGLGNVSAPYKATQNTITFRTAGRGVLRIQQMDARISDWNRNANKDSAGALASAGFAAYMTGPECFIRGRNGGKPTAFLQQSATLNEALRKAYRMN